jgi:PAS domain S-box-containing protein
MNTDRKRILIVDDDESTRRTLTLIFEMKGYEIETAETGCEALEKARDRAFNLAILDLRLPDMDGVELLTPLKDAQPDIALIMVTGYASVKTAIRALNDGASGYITKPVDMEEVLAKVRDLLERQRLVEDRRQVEEEIRRLKEFNETIVQTVPGAIVVTDAEGIFTFVNPATTTLVGYAPEELLGQHWSIIFPPDQQSIVESADVRRMKGKADCYELELERKDGTRLPILISGSPRFDADTGCFAGTMAVLTDISERVRAEEAREKLIAELEEALSQVKQLQGFLPICSYCKKIRDDQNYWQQVETYIEEHSEAFFTHSICPDCYHEHVMPELEELRRLKGQNSPAPIEWNLVGRDLKQ